MECKSCPIKKELLGVYKKLTLATTNYMKEAVELTKRYQSRGIACSWYMASNNWRQNRDQSRLWYVIRADLNTSKELIAKHKKDTPNIDLLAPQSWYIS